MARSRSRRSTPSSPPKPVGRPTRTTRTSGRKQESVHTGTQQALQSSSVGTDPSAHTRTRSTKGKTKVDIEQKLPAVQEHEGIEYPALSQGQARIDLEEDDDDVDSDDDHQIDFRTALSDDTTHTAAEREALQFDDLVYELTPLFWNSSRILGMFDVFDVEKVVNLHVQLQVPGSQENSRLDKLLDEFQKIRSLFGTSGYLINQSIVIQVLCRVKSWSEVGNGLWRPDCIFQLGNLAEIMSALFPNHRESRAVGDALAHLHNDFPNSFMNGLSRSTNYADVPGLSKLEAETIELALDLRTHYAIQVLMEHRNDPSFDPDDITRLIFYSDNEHFRGWDTDILQDDKGNAPRELESMIQARVEALREHFSTDSSHSVDFSSLNEAFPWMNLLTSLCQWVHLRTQELKEEVQVRGGADRIEKLLLKGELDEISPVEEFQGHSLSLERSPQMSRRLRPSANIIPRTRTSLDNAYRLRELEHASIAPQATNHSQAPRHIPIEPTPSLTAAPPDQELAAFGDDATIVPTQASVASPRRTQTLINRLSVQRKEGNKENINEGPHGHLRQAFIDRQEGARRLNFDSQEPVAGPSTSRIRSLAEDDEEDDDFQADTRPQRQRRRVTAPPPPTGQSNEPDETTGMNVEDEEEEEDAVHERVDIHLSNVQVQLPPRPERYEVINQAARFKTKVINRGTAPPQTRKPFSQEEVNRIIELVEAYGTSWTLIKTMDEKHPDGPKLTERSQVALKDKCRNMVMDFYKSGVSLPVNFDLVALKTKDQQIVDQLTRIRA